jgi:anti-sigma B factor antagonist
MNVTVRHLRSALILDLHGPITFDSHGRILHIIEDDLQQGHRNFVLNLGGVSWIDSAGLGELLTIYSRVHVVGGNVRLLNLTKRLASVLAITKLATVFEVEVSEAAIIWAESA